MYTLQVANNLSSYLALRLANEDTYKLYFLFLPRSFFFFVLFPCNFLVLTGYADVTFSTSRAMCRHHAVLLERTPSQLTTFTGKLTYVQGKCLKEIVPSAESSEQ